MAKYKFSKLCLISMAMSAAVGIAAEAAKPNVVIIYGDDVGFGDVGAYGAKLIPTPNIDRLAAEGIRFTDGHSSASTCTPSRFSMLTGVHGFRHGVSILPPNAPLCIPTDIFTLPKMFRQAGYRTHVIGKWHLGLGTQGVPTDWNGDVKPGPLEIGFDSSLLLPSTNDRVPCVYLEGHRVLNLDPSDPLYVSNQKKNVMGKGNTQYPDGRKDRSAMTYYKSSHGHNNSVINGIGRMGYMSGGKSALWNDETIADVFVEAAKKFITENKDRPFFLYFASHDVHVPRAPNPRFHGMSKLGYRGDSMVQFDWTTGEIMKVLDDNGLTDNTIVIFSSDNGPVYDDGYKDGTTVHLSNGENDRGHDASGIYSGGKYKLEEGGTRVPFIIRWPARIQPGVSSALVNQIDLMASFAALLDLDLPNGAALDSRNALPALLGEDREVGLPFMIEEDGKDLGLRTGEWKFMSIKKKTGQISKLFNLKTDPGEKKNLVSEHPERAAKMGNKLNQLIEAKGVRP